MMSAAILEKLPPSWTHTLGDRGAAGQIDPMGLGNMHAKCLAFCKNSQIFRRTTCTTISKYRDDIVFIFLSKIDFIELSVRFRMILNTTLFFYSQ